MRKPQYLSNKKWNRKFKENVKKFQNLSNPKEDRINKPSSLLADRSFGTKLLQKCSFFLCLLSFVNKTVTYILMKLNDVLTGINDGRAQDLTTRPLMTIMEMRVGNLEKTLSEYVDKIQSLQQQMTEQAERLVKLMEKQNASNRGLLLDNSHLQMTETISSSAPVYLPAPVFTNVAPPPPPPPPPPPIFSIQNQPFKRKLTTTANKPSQKPQMMRPAISLEDIISVKLKKTPFAQRNDRIIKLTPSNEHPYPRISLEALRSVKLKKTSALLLKETSPVKSKSPKGKIRHVLRRLPMTFSPGGTPKGGRSNVLSDQDDMTPVMARALLKRFDAFQMSPDSEENKENDIQFM